MHVQTIGGCSFTVRFPGGSFLLAKVSLGLTSLLFTELSGVRYSDVRNVIVLRQNRSEQVICPLSRGSYNPLFGGSLSEVSLTNELHPMCNFPRPN